MGNDMYNDEQLAHAKAMTETATLRLALETATRERDEARRIAGDLREMRIGDEERLNAIIAKVVLQRDEARAELVVQRARPATCATSELDTRWQQMVAAFDALRRERDAAVALIREVAEGGVEFEDERVRYVAVQIDRETWAAVRALAQEGAPE